MGIRSFFARLFRRGPAEEPVGSGDAGELPDPSSPYAKLAASATESPVAETAGDGQQQPGFIREAAPSLLRKTAEDYRSHDIFLIDGGIERPRSTVGLYFPEREMLIVRDPQQGTVGRVVRWQGSQRVVPIFGDWLGLGREQMGFYDPKESEFLVWRRAGEREPASRFYFGPAELGWVPVIGDWTGAGADGIGLYDPASSSFVLKNRCEPGPPDLVFMYGAPGLGWLPLAGDWDGDGRAGVGVYDPLSGTFLLRNELSAGNHDLSLVFPEAGPDWAPLVGDWGGAGFDSVGVYDPATRTFYLCTRVYGEAVDTAFVFGPAEIEGCPLSLRWDGSSEAEADASQVDG